jgi:hypothetical protein
MGGWGKAKKAAGKSVEDLEKTFRGYSYDSPKDIARTDAVVRSALKKELLKARQALLGIIELAYKEEEDEISRNLESVRDELDGFITELGIIRSPRKEPDERALEKVARADALLMRSARELTERAGQLKSEVLQSVASGVVRKSQQMRDFVFQMENVYSERAGVLA